MIPGVGVDHTALNGDIAINAQRFLASSDTGRICPARHVQSAVALDRQAGHLFSTFVYRLHRRITVSAGKGACPLQSECHTRIGIDLDRLLWSIDRQRIDHEAHIIPRDLNALCRLGHALLHGDGNITALDDQDLIHFIKLDLTLAGDDKVHVVGLGRCIYRHNTTLSVEDLSHILGLGIVHCADDRQVLGLLGDGVLLDDRLLNHGFLGRLDIGFFGRLGGLAISRGIAIGGSIAIGSGIAQRGRLRYLPFRHRSRRIPVFYRTLLRFHN